MSQPRLRQSGFTIIELLIVIVVIGILAALVLTSFAGVQAKARDTERQTDIKSVSAQLEAYYANKGFYPTQTQMTGTGSGVGINFVTAELKGLDAAALTAPGGTGYTLTNTSTPTLTGYGYVVEPASCDNTATLCTSFNMYYRAESETGQPVKVKASVNQP